MGGDKTEAACIKQLSEIELALRKFTIDIKKNVFSKKLFSQIILDAKTGIVSFSTDSVYLVRDSPACIGYTEKGKLLHRKLHTLFNEVQYSMNVRDQSKAELEAEFSKLNFPIKKVFDGLRSY